MLSNRTTREAEIARLEGEIGAMEQKYGLSSAEMLTITSRNPSRATWEIGKWLTSYRALRVLMGIESGIGIPTRTTA